MIYILYAPPGQGKSVMATVYGLESMDSGRDVYSNYPIYNARRKRHSFIWHRKYVFENIYDSDVIIDEAYQDYGSNARGGKYGKSIDEPGFTKDEHTMFCTNRHNNNNYYLIAQNFARIDVIIREVASIIKVEKQRLPGGSILKGIAKTFIRIFKKDFRWVDDDIILFFHVTGYYGESALVKDDSYYEKIYFNLPFSRVRRAFKSFDTHFFRKHGSEFTGMQEWSFEDTEESGNVEPIEPQQAKIPEITFTAEEIAEILKAASVHDEVTDKLSPR